MFRQGTDLSTVPDTSADYIGFTVPNDPPAPSPPTTSPPADPAPTTPGSQFPAPNAPAVPTEPPEPPSPVNLFDNMPQGLSQDQATDPVFRDVQGEETVQGQLTNLFENPNPVLTQARENALQASQERGLANSSLGVQAGEQAYIGKAYDIASSDATVFNTAARDNHATASRFAELDRAFTHQQALSRQSYDQSALLSEQGFRQAIELSIQDYNEQTRILGQELANQLQLSAQDHEQLLQRLSTEHTNTLDQIGVRARLDRVQSALDQNEALEFERLRSELDIVQIQAQSDARAAEMAIEIENRLQEIAAQAGAQDLINAQGDSRKLQSQYLAESGAMVRQAMQDIQAVNVAQGLSATQQRNAVADIRRQLEADLSMLQSLYAGSPVWGDDWEETPGEVVNPNPVNPPWNPDDIILPGGV